MLRSTVLIWSTLVVLLLLALVRHVRCTGPYKLSRIVDWRLRKRPVVLWWDRLFLGWGRNWFGFTRFAFGREEDSVAIVGPPRVGKTAGVLIPQLGMFSGAAVVTSTKPDVLRATMARRRELARLHGGDVYVYAPAATAPVEGLTPIRWSPLAGCRDQEIAARRVETLVSVAEVGKNVENADHWRAGAARILRAYFHAAAEHPERPGDFAVVRSWLSLHEFREPVTILLGLGTEGGRQWAEDLIGIAERTNDKERSSFFAAAATAVKATAVPAVLQSCSGTDIDPDEFIRTRSTLYIVSPSVTQTLVAPLVSALIESLVVTAYQLHGEHRPRRRPILRQLVEVGRCLVTGQDPPRPEPGSERPARLLLQLDELTNIAPLPSLESIASQGAGQGVLTSWAVQSQAQLRNRYGPEAAEAIWSATRCKIIFGGLADGPSLDHLSKLIGDQRVETRSRSIGLDGQRHETRGHEWRPRLSPADLRQLPPKWAVLLYHHHKPYALRAPVAARRWRMRQVLKGAAVAAQAPITAEPAAPSAQQAPTAPTAELWTNVRPQVVHLDEAGTPTTRAAANGGGREVEE